MAGSVRDFLDQLITFQYNPSAIQRAQMQTVLDVTGGVIQIVDATNPLVLALESAAVLTAGFMEADMVLTRKQYAIASQTAQDLYLHMSDQDYIDRFAVPALTQFSFVLPKDELVNKMILDPTTGIRKVTIPRNTSFTIADTVFTMQYPIEIRVLAHGGIQVVYDTDEISPLQALSSNLIDWELARMSGVDYITFQIDVYQMKIYSLISPTNQAKTFSLQVKYDDSYYYARIYHENADGSWSEILTTHTPMVFDITTPTAVLQVDEINSVLSVVIPQIYSVAGLITRRIRTDLYTTKGQIQMQLGAYGIGDTAIVFETWDTSDDLTYSAPLNTLSEKYAYSQDNVNGGAAALTFLELRQRVIDNSTGPQDIPITNVQITDALQRKGYTLVTNVDNITNRQFLATRPLPDPVNTKLLTAAGALNATVQFSLDEVASHSYAIDNGPSITITPDALYKDVNGVISLVSDAEIAAIDGLPNEQKALIVTNGLYRYTPFHYVLDNSGVEFAVRPYYLDGPTVETKLFVSENDTTGLQVGTGQYGIVRTPSGYKVQIATNSSDAFKALDNETIFVQLAYIPFGENTRAYLNGTYVGQTTDGKNERIFEFDLSTTFDVEFDEVSNSHLLQLSKFFMFTLEPRLTGANLTTDFDILYATSQPMDVNWVAGEVDGVLGRFMLPQAITGITHETLRVQFGDPLDRLWARARSVISSIVYATWDVDVFRYYAADVYQRDPVTGSAITIVDGKPTYVILHHQGDQVFNDDGTPVYQNRIGDVKLDAQGNPIPSNPRGMLRQIDFMLIEGVYRYGTDTSSQTYRDQLITSLLSWLTGDLETLEGQLLEQTELYFYPKQTLGAINVLNNSNLTTQIEAGQSMLLTLYVPPAVYVNEDLKAQLTSISITAISTALQNTTVERSQIITSLMGLYGADVLDAEINGLGGAADMSIFTLLDDSTRCSLRKRLVAQTDDSLIIQEDLTINFVQHGITA